MRKPRLIWLCVGMMAMLFSACQVLPASPLAPTELTTTTAATTITATVTTSEIATQTTFDTPETTFDTPSPTHAEAPTPDEWQIAYLRFLEDTKDRYRSYALVYIDDDAIPELYLSGRDEATGDRVCSYQNGTLVEQALNRTGGGNYIARSGKLYNKNGNMGAYYTHVYELTDSGFSTTLRALEVERILTLESGEYTLSYEYSIEDMPVTKAEYDEAVKAAFDLTQATALNDYIVGYEEIKQHILHHE